MKRARYWWRPAPNAGMADRTARNWMRLARSGLDAPNIVAAGGVRAALLTLANPKAVAIVERQMGEAARDPDIGHVADLPESAVTPAPVPNPAISGPREVPAPAGTRPVVHGSGLAAGDHRSVQAGAQPAESAGDADPALETDPARGMTRYAWRRAMGDCTVCGAPADGRARCPGCARALADRRARAAELARIGRDLAPRIDAAAASGDGLTLTAADVARLAGGGPVPERCGRTVDWVGE